MVQLLVKDHQNHFHSGKVALDSGNRHNFIISQLTHFLLHKFNKYIIGLGGSSIINQSLYYQAFRNGYILFQVSQLFWRNRVSIYCWHSYISFIAYRTLNEFLFCQPSLEDLTDNSFDISKIINILIDANKNLFIVLVKCQQQWIYISDQQFYVT